jgi:hypothetical protein
MMDVDIKYTQIFINNEWHKAENGKTFSVINPSTGEEICQVEEATRVRIHMDIYQFQLIRIFHHRWMLIKQLKQLVKRLVSIRHGVN